MSRLWRLCVSLALSFILLQSTLAVPAQTAVSSPQGSSFLQKSLDTLVGNVALSDITLTGSVRRIVGADDESGSVSFRAVNGSSKILLNLPSGTRSETRTVSDAITSGTWSGPDGVAHSIPLHNLVADANLFPAFTVLSILSNPNSAVIFVGQETRNGQAVIHLTTLQQFPAFTGDTADFMQRLSQVDIFLDSASNIPVAFAFNIHADDNALLNIPVEIQFSDYRSTSGVLIPFHIQKSMNGSLFLDVQFQSASVNSGISAAQVGAL